MMRWISVLLLAIASFTAFAEPPVEAALLARADEPKERNCAEEPQAALPRISASEAALVALESNGGGKVLDVRPADGGYRVLVEKKGEVRMLFVPGA